MRFTQTEDEMGIGYKPKWEEYLPHSEERQMMLEVSAFVSRAAQYVARQASREEFPTYESNPDWLAYRLLSAISEQLNVEGLLYR